MKQITFLIRKEKINKKNLTIAIAIVLLLLVVGGYILIQRVGWISEFNLGPYLQRLVASLGIITEKETKEEVKPEELEITLPAPPSKIYEQTAEAGEGITHLARKAVKEYLKERGEGQNLTLEHKIYVEDYLQKKTGDRWLNLGETVTFSEELIKEAIEKSQQLTNDQLENLKQYSAQVSF